MDATIRTTTGRMVDVARFATESQAWAYSTRWTNPVHVLRSPGGCFDACDPADAQLLLADGWSYSRGVEAV